MMQVTSKLWRQHVDPHTCEAILICRYLSRTRIVVMQLTSPVQWETTLKTLLERGVQKSYEIGPNKVIAGIMKRIDKKHGVINVQV